MKSFTLASMMPPTVLAHVADLELDLSQWDQNPRIGGLLSQTVLAGGKRIRPLMTFLMADFFGVSAETIRPFAKTVELVHASTLAHDDVIDDATHRRGLPSINAVASNKKAVLSGDFLLAYAVDLVAKQGEMAVVRELTQMIRDLAEGEWVQLENSTKTDLSRQDVQKVATFKTATVMRWCCLVPAILSGLPESQLQDIRKVGDGIGLAFQMTDDILDFTRRDQSKLADVKNKVINSVIFEALALRSDMHTQHTGADATGDSPRLDLSTVEAIDIESLNIDAGIAIVREEVAHILTEAHDALARIHQHLGADDPERTRAFEGMVAIIDFLKNRA